jgi:hypothetical protein
MASFTDRVTTVTQDEILPSVIDNVLGDNWISYRLLSNGRKWVGESLKRPVKVSKSDLGGSFSGLDTHSTSTVDTRRMMVYRPKAYEMPVAIPGLEKVVNRTPAQVINLVRVELESAQEDACDDIGDMLYADGTGNSSKDFEGWDNLIDDGTTLATFGELTRSSYTPNLDSTRTASGGTLTLAKLATLMSAVSAGSASRQRPTVMVSDETVWDLYESLLSPTVRANYESHGMPAMTRASKAPVRSAELRAGAGFTSLTYRGLPWIADEKSTSETIWVVNERYMHWYGIKDSDLKQISLGTANIDGVYQEIPSKNTGFQWTGFMRPINQYGEVAHLYLLGNQVCWHARRQGRLTGVTGV